ncbi:MAG: RNA polymerase sigma factor [Myxococcales bacterium]|nr:RNA polymerase sigma factor [Myxococcales bacterium]
MSGKILPFRRPAAPPEKIPAGLSDEALLLACGAGDSAALGELYERFHAVVYRVLSRLVGTTCAELDDLVQATFIEVMRAAIHFQRRSSVRSYILGIASNLARHHHRSQQRRQRMEVSLQPGSSVTCMPEHEAAQRELVQRLFGALDDLPHDQRVAFVMCDLEEVAGVDAARALGVPEGTLWRRLHEARKALRSSLAERAP